MPGQSAAARRRVGRPRRDGRERRVNPTEEILGVAATLFGELGVEGTTMTRVARTAGLGQSSLYYYFRNRDELVAALVERANVVPLDLIDQVCAGPWSPAAKLLRFVRGDVVALCELPFDINEVHRVAAREREREHFAVYWKERGLLQIRLSRLIIQGTESGQLRDVDPGLTGLTIMANDEGVQNWYRLGSRRRPVVIGQAVAELTVGGLLTEGERLNDVIEEASGRR